MEQNNANEGAILSRWLAVFSRLFDSLFQAQIEGGPRWPGTVWLTGLYLMGVYLWGKFLNWGNIPFDFHDWAEVWAPRIALVKNAVMRGMLPLHIPDAADSTLRGVTDRFLCLPDIMLSPQMLLLRFMEVGPFFLVNVLLLFSIGMLGLLWLKRRFKLSLAAFSILFFLFNFNGHILSHLSIGHASWCGYFLLPLFFVLVVRLLDGDKSWGWVASVAFLLFFIFLQGAFHPFVWCLIFLGLLAVGSLQYFVPVLKALVASVLLSMVRIVPPILMLGQFDDEFLGGYPSLYDMWQALVRLVPPQESLSFRSMLSVLGWWELDIYVGLSGALFILVFGIYRWLRSQKEHEYHDPLVFPILVMVVLSIGRVYQLVRLIPIPLFSGERVSSRMLILPLLFLVLIGCIELQRWFEKLQTNQRTVQWLWLAALLVLVHDLWQHLKLWQVSNAFNAFPFTARDLSLMVVSNHADELYFNALWLGSAISALSLLALTLLIIFEKRRAKTPSA